MKILWLYRHIEDYNFDHWLHMSFARYMAAYPGVDLRAYGPGISGAHPSLAVRPCQDRVSMAELHNQFPFDVAIVNTKSRCFEHYNPFNGEAFGMWLPRGFAEWDRGPKLVIEEDYHYESGDEWYAEMGIDLILQRHFSQTLPGAERPYSPRISLSDRPQTVPMKFFPFSVDTTAFNPGRAECTHNGQVICLPTQQERRRTLAFVGNCADATYEYRRNATNMLVKARLAVSYAGSNKQDGEYIEVLRKFIGYISCGSKVQICAAKNLEIMASGGVLFTNRFMGIDEIFDPGSYCGYENDMSDVIQQAKRVVHDEDYRNDVLSKSRECITQRHTHDIRIAQLLDIIKELL